jgi:hypothetical protein
VKAFEAATGGGGGGAKGKRRCLKDADEFVGLCKKWRVTGQVVSILRARTIYVQYADDDRGRLRYYTALPVLLVPLQLLRCFCVLRFRLAAASQSHRSTSPAPSSAAPRVPTFVQDIAPAPETVALEEALMFEEEEDDAVMAAKSEAAQGAAAAAAAAGEGEGGEREADALAALEDASAAHSGKGATRTGDQQMSLGEFKAALARLAWLLCKGKDLKERLEMFASQYLSR